MMPDDDDAFPDPGWLEAVTGPMREGDVYDGASGALLHTFLPPAPKSRGGFGCAVAAVPDTNGDGRPEAIVGAYGEDPGGVKDAGRVVIDNLRFDRFHDEPGRALVGKPNGKNGPDLLASGALGFTALTEHMNTAFSLLDLRPRGPAAKAGVSRWWVRSS